MRTLQVILLTAAMVCFSAACGGVTLSQVAPLTPPRRLILPQATTLRLRARRVTTSLRMRPQGMMLSRLRRTRRLSLLSVCPRVMRSLW